MIHEVVSTQINQTELQSVQEEVDYSLVPLYLRPDGHRGKKQELDRPTVEFMYDQAFGTEEPTITHITQVLPNYIAPEYNNTVPNRKFYPDEIHYKSVHGAEHSGVVGTYTEVAGQAFGLTPRQIEVLKMSAYTHDFFRDRDDDPDTGHGDRSARWYLEEESAEELRSSFSDKENMLIAEISRYHDLPWEQVSAEIDSENITMHMAFRLADALERYRIDRLEWQPQAARMHFPESVDSDALLLFAKNFSIRVRLSRFRDGLSIEEALKKESILAGLVKPTKGLEEKANENVLFAGEEVYV